VVVGVAALAAQSDVVVVCVKPPQVPEALDAVGGAVGPSSCVISAAAGIPLRKLRTALGARGLLVRAMPNVNVAVRASVTTLCAEPGESAAMERADWVFRQVGRTVKLPDEALMDASMAVAGCGPALVSLVMEALMDGAVRMGLPRSIASDLVLGMFEGTAQHLAKTGVHPAALKDMVMSPSGTTAAAWFVLERRGTRGALMEAVEAAVARANEMERSGG
jgi:pyrroline-5-carboxylate reductase